MRVLITGGTGYIGSAVAGALSRKGHEVSSLARSEEAEAKLAARGIRPVRGSLEDPNGLAVAASDVDAVVHAGMTGNHRTAEVDQLATRAFLDALSGSGKRFVYTSGTLIYGSTQEGVEAGEDAPFAPPALTAWRATLDPQVQAAREDGVHSVVIRPSWVYGRFGGPAMMFFGMAKQDGAASHVGDGANRWATVHVDDLAELYVAALERAPAGAVYNASNGDAVRARDIAAAASHAAGAEGRVRSWPVEQARQALGPFADAHLIDQAVSSARAARELEWRPTRSGIVAEFASMAA